MAYEFYGYWQDIGTPDAYYTANMELTHSCPLFTLNHTRTVLTQSLDLPPAEVLKTATVVNSIISPGCVIKGHVENSILSPGVYIEEQAEVRNSVLMTDVSIGFHSVVDTCIIDEGVKIDKLCYLGFGRSLLPEQYDLTVIGKGAYIPSNTAIGRDCRILPHVDASCFRGNLINSGMTVTQHSVSKLKEKLTRLS